MNEEYTITREEMITDLRSLEVILPEGHDTWTTQEWVWWLEQITAGMDSAVLGDTELCSTLAICLDAMRERL